MTTQTKTTWREANLGDVATLHRGYDLPVEKIEKGSFPVVFSNGKIEFHNKYKIKGPGVITGRSGSLGNIFYVAKDYWPHNTTLYVSDFHENDPKFIYYLFKRLDFTRFNAGTGVPTLNRNHIHGLNVLIPKDIKNQKRIADVLSAFDDKIELNNKISRTLEQMAQAIFKEWFVNSEKSKMKSEKLLNLGKIICGKTPSKSNPEYFGGEISFIKIPDMHNQIFILKTEDSLTEAGANSQKTKFVPKNSICVSCIATVGLVSITTQDSQTNQQINTIIPKSDNWLEFLYLVLRMIKNDLILIGSGGSTTLNINTNVFSNIEILIPREETLDKFHKLTNPIFDKILLITKENQKLAVLRDLLLPKLMSGEIRV